MPPSTVSVRILFRRTRGREIRDGTVTPDVTNFVVSGVLVVVGGRGDSAATLEWTIRLVPVFELMR